MPDLLKPWRKAFRYAFEQDPPDFILIIGMTVVGTLFALGLLAAGIAYLVERFS